MNSHCSRCKCPGPTETLVFKSQYKTTELDLCTECFESARTVFINWMEGKSCSLDSTDGSSD